MKLSVNMSTDHASTERAIYGHFGLHRGVLRPFWACFGGFGGHFGPVLGGGWRSFWACIGSLEAILGLFLGSRGHLGGFGGFEAF